MANLCLAGTMAVNGVSALHSEILRKDVFKEACQMMPDKFKNVTNGIDHRRWLPQINRGLNDLICDLTGDGYLTRPQELKSWRLTPTTHRCSGGWRRSSTRISWPSPPTPGSSRAWC